VVGGFSGDGGPATAAQLNPTNPLGVFSMGVAVDADGNLSIVEYGNNRVRKVDKNGIISTVVGGRL
jgi:hypothetical protein